MHLFYICALLFLNVCLRNQKNVHEILPLLFWWIMPRKKLHTNVHLCRGKENVWKFAWKYEARLIKTTREMNSMNIFTSFCPRLILSISILSIYEIHISTCHIKEHQFSRRLLKKIIEYNLIYRTKFFIN